MALKEIILPILVCLILPASGYAQGAGPENTLPFLTQDLHLPLTVSIFAFHSNPWINLHHFLLQQAQPNARLRSPTSGGPLSAEEQKDWDAAVAYYQKNLVGRQVVFDDDMIKIDAELARGENASALDAGSGLPAPFVKILNRAWPIYRKHWWPAHDATNRFWIACTEPLVRTFGRRLQDQIAAAYGTKWYPEPVRVDVCNYAGPMLVAYTTGAEHGHTIMPGSDARVQGFAALETLFHEAAHTIVDPGESSIGKAIEAATKANKVPEPEDLWHALMFYTTGELVRRNLESVGYTSYEPYADKNDMWRGPWRNYRGVLSVFWRQHLDGKLSLDEAMRRMLAALALDTAPMNPKP